MCPGITKKQLILMHPGKSDQIVNLLDYLKKQNRLFRDKCGNYYSSADFSQELSEPTRKAVWVLLDFFPNVEYHASSDDPVKIVFFMNGEEYQIVHVPVGKEAITAAKLNLQKNDQARRIILMESLEQIHLLPITGVIGYCTVGDYGQVQYYQLKEKDNSI